MGKMKGKSKKAQTHSTTPKRKAVKRPACCNVPKSTRPIGTKPDGGKPVVGGGLSRTCDADLPINPTGQPGIIARDAAQNLVSIAAPASGPRQVLCCENGSIFWGAAP